jgi:hypothetical protein
LTALSNSPEQELFPGPLRGSGSPETHGEPVKVFTGLRLFSLENYSRRLTREWKFEPEQEIEQKLEL